MNLEYFNPPLSKRAWELEDLWTQISSIWHTNEGFCENFFRILSYLIPWVPGLGWGVFILEKIAAVFGYGLASLGAAIDGFVGWAPNPQLNITEDGFFGGFGEFLKKALTPTIASTEEEIVKLALFGGLMKLVSAFPKLLRILWQAVKFLLLAFGFSKVGEIYSAAEGLISAPSQMLFGKDKVQDKDKDSGTGTGISLEQMKGLMNLKPTDLVKPFTNIIT